MLDFLHIESLTLLAQDTTNSVRFTDMADFDLKDYLNLLVFFLRVSLRLYYWVLTLRLTMQWFPNINPYIHPMYALLYATDFFLENFDGLLPNVLGLDMATMCAFTCLEWMIRTVDSIYFY